MQNKVPFDPGYYEFSIKIPAEAGDFIDEIARLKKPHQRKFEFRKFEMQTIPALKQSAAIFLGCVLWGSYLSHRHKDAPRQIEGNVIMKLAPEQREDVDYSEEIDFLTEFIDKFNKASVYHLRRPSKIGESLKPILEAYREFCQLNDHFKNLDRTDQIKLPAAVEHFKDYDEQKLEELKAKIDQILASRKIDKLLDVGFYLPQN